MASARGDSPNGACGATPRDVRRPGYAGSSPLTATSSSIHPMRPPTTAPGHQPAPRHAPRRPTGAGAGHGERTGEARGVVGHEESGFIRRIVRYPSLASGQRVW